MTEDREVNLSGRELEVLIWIAEGWTSKQVAAKLGIGKKTVDFHLARIYSKLGVNSRIQAFAKAASLGLLPAPRTLQTPEQNPPPSS